MVSNGKIFDQWLAQLIDKTHFSDSPATDNRHKYLW